MIGYNAPRLIADGYLKKKTRREKALLAHAPTMPIQKPPTGIPIKTALASYRKLGWFRGMKRIEIAFDEVDALRRLEHRDKWRRRGACPREHDYFMRVGQLFKNIYDSSIGGMRSKDRKAVVGAPMFDAISLGGGTKLQDVNEPQFRSIPGFVPQDLSRA